ncbi:uncharacterized protein LOC119072567 [Bradysia coprophila]|uniref:uncharacterized protein LOC119072567 n=1 Tax=Bradysia coprophila TaxID=38358 RepID=UPI00187D8DD9|nr:uncharacterized protein LOC119072567 [Bradysia coprophila]
MATGFSFADDPQMSVREKIERYFQQKNKTTMNTVSVLDESTSDESLVDSFSRLDESFANILINNPHVTLIRNSKKGNTTQTQPTQTEKDDEGLSDETFHEYYHPQTPQPTRRGQVICPIGNADSNEKSYPFMWQVSDESFLEMEKLCESPRKSDESFLEMEQLCESPQNNVNDTTLLDDVEAPSFLVHDSDSDDSVFEPVRKPVSIMSPIKLVGLRRPSTILEESSIRSLNSSEERSSNSLSLRESVNVAKESSKPDKTRSYRPSVANVFPTMKGRIGFYDNFDSPSTRSSSKSAVTQSSGKENSINLMRFDSIENDLPSASSATPATGNNSVSLIRFDSSVDEASFSNLSVDQAELNSSMSDGEPPDQFNDTLEAVDYYMKQGKKIMDKTGASTTFYREQQAVPSPKSRNNSLLKQALARRTLLSMNGDNLNKLANKKLF